MSVNLPNSFHDFLGVHCVCIISISANISLSYCKPHITFKAIYSLLWYLSIQYKRPIELKTQNGFTKGIRSNIINTYIFHEMCVHYRKEFSLWIFLQDSTDGNLTTSTLTFIPTRLENGRSLSCRASNHFVRDGVKEASVKLNVFCELDCF